jgi:hypothetical protein
VKLSYLLWILREAGGGLSDEERAIIMYFAQKKEEFKAEKLAQQDAGLALPVGTVQAMEISPIMSDEEFLRQLAPHRHDKILKKKPGNNGES